MCWASEGTSVNTCRSLCDALHQYNALTIMSFVNSSQYCMIEKQSVEFSKKVIPTKKLSFLLQATHVAIIPFFYLYLNLVSIFSTHNFWAVVKCLRNQIFVDSRPANRFFSLQSFPSQSSQHMLLDNEITLQIRML